MMGNNNPGRYRKEGRNAFISGEDANDSCPYVDTIWSHRDDWIEGWMEAQKGYDQEQKEKEKYQEDNWQFQVIRDKIELLQADPAIIDILEDLTQIMEDLYNG